MAVAQGQVLIGTSGWSYAHWREVFYPRGLASREYLRFYATQFPTVEINSSFYHLPRETTVAWWAATTPAHFCFAVKASSYLTHRLRLRGCEKPLAALLSVMRGLGSKLGPLLFQLPPSLSRDWALLAAFLDLLPPDLRAAVEFRHKSWYEDGLLDLLASRKVALCVHDFRGCETPAAAYSRATASFVYVRFHGPKSPYTGSYDQKQLFAWAELVRTWSAQGRDVYIYFNNDVGGHAVQNARQLQSLLAGS